MIKRSFLLSFFLPLSLMAQQPDYTYWNQLVNWDGVTPWQNYLSMSPAFMGPHALANPPLFNDGLGERPSVSMWAPYAFGQGDQSLSAFFKVYIPFDQGRIATELWYNPVERYRTTAAVRDERKARDFEAEGWAAGDVHVRTTVLLWKEKARRPYAMVSAYLKTASGTDLANARYTDTPGYAFELHTGKRIALADPHTFLRLYGKGGFFAWQTHDDTFLQNDAITYGVGLGLTRSSWKLDASLDGYIGYLDNGDRPFIGQIEGSHSGKSVELFARYRHGIRDFPYQIFTLGFRIPLSFTTSTSP
ncbi:MAG: hypothetical protein AAFR61_19675 [Bacteroidota bacterium]